MPRRNKKSATAAEFEDSPVASPSTPSDEPLSTATQGTDGDQAPPPSADGNQADPTAARKWHVSTKAEREATEAEHAECAAQWRRHKKYPTSSARHFIQDVHGGFRRAFDGCVEQWRREKKVDRKRFEQICRALDGHHRNEDAAWFPRLAAERPELAAGLAYLSRDHKQLHPLERRAARGDGEALVEFVAFLMDHLNREEMLIVPTMLSEA